MRGIPLLHSSAQVLLKANKWLRIANCVLLNTEQAICMGLEQHAFAIMQVLNVSSIGSGMGSGHRQFTSLSLTPIMRGYA